MGFHSLLGDHSPKPSSGHRSSAKSRENRDSVRSKVLSKSKKTVGGKRGCEYCPLNEVHGIQKIFGHVHGREIFVWGQSPGQQENKHGKELIGRSGEWLWEELKKVHITREMCDIQNVVRCVPADRQREIYPPLKMRTPSKEEIKCCSVFNEKALEKQRAKLHLVFGAIAHKSLLGAEYKKDRRIFWSENLEGWVVCLDHPSYFLHQGYSAGDNRPPNIPLKKFREDLQRGVELLKKKGHDQFEFIKSLNTIGITTRKMARWAYGKIKRGAERGARAIIDMEEGTVHGKRKALCCGFSVDTKTSYTFCLDHPNVKISDRARRLNHKLVRRLIENRHIRKGAHYGASDCDAVVRLLKSEIKGYDYDTLLAEFFADPDAKSYGLDALSERKYTDFAGYKDIRAPECFVPEYRKKIERQKKLTLHKAMETASKTGQINLALMPWPKMVLYNGADCIIEKRSEKATKDVISKPLMGIYKDASFILYRMERDKACLPLFDYRWHDKLTKLFPVKVKQLARRVKKLAGTRYIYLENKKGEQVKKKFNPGSNDHIKWLLYDKMKLPVLGRKERDGSIKRSTKAPILGMLLGRYPKISVIIDYRKVKKIQSTYMDGFVKCANLNHGHLRTNWKMTGTGTGRLSSGATKDKTNDAVINFQNIHGDPLLQCLLVSDLRWYDIYEYWLKHGDFTDKTWRKFEDYYVHLGFDFSQMELRVLAQRSGDKNLIAIFESGADLHVEVGHALTGWPREQIAKDPRIRRLAKGIHFGIVYGLKGKSLFEHLTAQGVETTLEEVEEYTRRYFERFPGVQAMIERDHAFAEAHEYVESMLGFRRKINVSQQKEMGEEWQGAYWGNQAVNTPIQSTAHNLMMVAIAMLKRKEKEYRRLRDLQLEIHDAMYSRIKLKYMWEGMKQGKKLLEEEPVRVAREEFELDWQVPLGAKPKAAFRFGVQVEDLGEKGLEHEWDFLNAWCRENKELESSYKTQLHEIQ